MAFYAKNFIFDGIPSEFHGLIISSDDGGEGSSNASNNVEIITQDIFRRSKPYFYGVKQNQVLEFPVRFTTTETEIFAEDASVIERWLFGQMTYKKLRIVQPDTEPYYFNCFLKDPRVIRVGNIVRGYSCDVVCDSPFAWGEDRTISMGSISNNDFTSASTTHIIYNASEDNYFTYPKLISMQGAVIGTSGSPYGFLQITNKSDYYYDEDNTLSYRTMAIGKNDIPTFSGSGVYNIRSGEIIEINCLLQTIVSDTDTTFRKINLFCDDTYGIQFFRLVPGKNELIIRGNVNNLTIVYTPAKRIN